MQHDGDTGPQLIASLTIAAPLEEVWQAMRDPDAIQHWFGWHASTLKDEIDFIFFEHAHADDGSHRLIFDEWEGASDSVTLSPVGPDTLVHVMRQGGPLLDGAGSYDGMIEGWITFFQQLRLALERHSGQNRQTIYLDDAALPGSGEPSVALGLDGIAHANAGDGYQLTLATGDTIRGIVWYRTRFQTALLVSEWGDGLLVVSDMGQSPKRQHGGGSVLITSYGLADTQFAALQDRWTEWWRRHFEMPAR